MRGYHETRITGARAGWRSRIGWTAVFLAARPGGLASLRGLGRGGAARRPLYGTGKHMGSNTMAVQTL